jgi:hypothetical protein
MTVGKRDAQPLYQCLRSWKEERSVEEHRTERVQQMEHALEPELALLNQWSRLAWAVKSFWAVRVHLLEHWRSMTFHLRQLQDLHYLLTDQEGAGAWDKNHAISRIDQTILPFPPAPDRRL